MYHAERLSPIEAMRYLSFFDYNSLFKALAINSLEYDIAVIYCIFVNAGEIQYRSKSPLMLKCQTDINYDVVSWWQTVLYLANLIIIEQISSL